MGKREDEELEDHEIPPVMNIQVDRTAEFSERENPWNKVGRDKQDRPRDK